MGISIKRLLIAIVVLKIVINSVVLVYNQNNEGDNVKVEKAQEVPKQEEKTKKEETKKESVKPVVEEVDDTTKVTAVNYIQSYDLFFQDNLNYRGDQNIISLKGNYIDYKTINPLFVGDLLKSDYHIKSGDVLVIDNVDYTVIDNKSNCNNFTNDYCVETLNNDLSLHDKEIIIK